MKTGFTILEILVVLAIITMIGSLIFTQLSRVRTRARDAAADKGCS
jgi:prepilin-type N-terminal cleavage/methylation domain-containing protein